MVLDADLAGVAVRLFSDCAAIDEVLRAYLGVCVSDRPLREDRIEVHTELVPSSQIDPRREIPSGLVATSDGYRLSATGGVRGRLSADRRRLDLEVVREFLLWTSYYRWLPFSTMLRLMLSVELPMRGGLVMHGASVALDSGGAALFIGESGAGKSTVCDLAGERKLFNDEISLISTDLQGFTLHPSPFFSRPERTKRALAPQPLRAIYVLCQSPEVKVEALRAPEAIALLFGCVLNFLDDRPSADRLLDIALRVVQAVPVKRLYFRKDTGFWPLVEKG